MKRNFLFIKSTTESTVIPVDSFSHAEYTSDTTVTMYFDAKRGGKDATIAVVLTVSSGKANDVISSITNQITSGKADIMRYDAASTPNKYHTSNVTGITSITTTESPSTTTGPAGATGPAGPTGATGAAGSDALALADNDQTLTANRLIDQNGSNLEIDVNGGDFSLDDVTHSYIQASGGELLFQGLKYPTSDGTSGQFIKTDGSGVLSFGTVNVSTLTQVYSQSFFDNIGTTKHFLPFKDINEQTQVYQEEAAMLMPFDGRIKSVSLKGSQVTGGGNFTVGIETLPVGDSIFSSSSWTEVETEQIAFGAADSNHVFHFVFDDAKHFDAGESCSISLQADSSPGSNTYWHVTTIVEFDTSNGLGSTSAEYETTP